MTQAELEREVAEATGETLDTIRRRGFSLLDIYDRPPRVVNWDALDERRVSYLPQRRRAKAA